MLAKWCLVPPTLSVFIPLKFWLLLLRTSSSAASPRSPPPHNYHHQRIFLKNLIASRCWLWQNSVGCRPVDTTLDKTKNIPNPSQNPKTGSPGLPCRFVLLITVFCQYLFLPWISLLFNFTSVIPATRARKGLGIIHPTRAPGCCGGR